ncbi:MAG: site-specific integrase [Bacillota bacterium]|nr:site-specific integrase [Bacillota bacterium]
MIYRYLRIILKGRGITINYPYLPVSDDIKLIKNESSDGVILLVKQMQSSEYLAGLQLLTEQNERNQEREFAGFSDLEVIYYYVHRKTHIREDRNKAVGTRREYLRNLLQFYKYIVEGSRYLKEDVEDYIEGEHFKNLRPRHIANFHEYLSTAPLGKQNKPYTAATIQSKSAVLKAFLRWMYEIGHIRFPLYEKVLYASISDNEIPNKDLYPDEAFTIIDYYKNHPVNYALFTTLMITGLRISEICNAKWKDITFDYSNGQYWLEGIGKRKRPFLKRISPVYFERIKEYRKRRKLPVVIDLLDNTPLFPDRNQKSYTSKNLSNYIIKAILDTKLPFLKGREKRITPHSFRHAFAIYLYREGADLYTIQKELGHSDPKTTTRYLEKAFKKENSAGYFIKDTSF